MTNPEPAESGAVDSPTALATEPEGEGGVAGAAIGKGGDGTPSILHRAAHRVMADWNDDPGKAEAEGVTAQVTRLVELIEEARDGQPETSGHATALRLRLLDGIRRELLRPVDEGTDEAVADAQLLEHLRSLESVREALEVDWARRFGLVLSGPHGVDVAAEIAHGLRSSCTSLLFVAEVLREGMYGELNEKQRQQVEVLYGAAVSLTSSLSDITELSWRTEEPGEGRPDAFSLEDLTDSVLRLVEPIAAAKGTEIDANLRVEAVRRGHPRPLRQMLLNLLVDAVLDAEGGQVSMEIREGEGGETVQFSIRATGADAREPADEVSGEGRYRILRQAVDDYSFSTRALRLHVARQLVRALGGELRHEVDDGSQRTEFSLILPFDRESDEKD